MVNKTWKGILLAALACGMTTHAIAQAPKGEMQLLPGQGGAFGKSLNRASVVESQGLNNPALRLSSAQNAEIDKIVSTYLEDQRRLAEKFPAGRAPPSVEAILAQDKVLVAFNTALSQVMDDEQRKAWKAAQAARLPKRDPQGLRPPGH